ncbi:MAG: DUF5686 family protein [Spirosomataceae bacterium]
MYPSVLKKKSWVFILAVGLWGVFLDSSAQQQPLYTITGRVTDAESGDPVPFANVALKGTTSGTTTNFEGFYTLKVKALTDSLVAASMGYAPRSKALDRKAASQVINFQLISTSVKLAEVKILASENPAYRIIRSLRENRKLHDKKRLTAYEYDSYSKIELDIDNLSDRFKERKIVKKITKVIDEFEKIAGEDGKPVLPTFLSETISKYYYRDDPMRKKEVILKKNIVGVGVKEGGVVSQLVGGNTFQNYNFYDNFIPFLGKDIASPIGENWRGMYEFFLADSIWVDDFWCYEIEFDPKRKLDLAFTGKMWVDSKTFALVQIDAQIGKEANINYIDKIKIQQELARTTDGAWLPAKSRILVDISELTKNSAGMLAKVYVSNRNFVVNQLKPLAFYEPPIEVAEDSKETDPKFWATARHDSLSREDKIAYMLIDSIRNLPIVRTYVEVAEIVTTGWKQFKGFELGPYIYSFALNRVEGLRLRVGFRTNDDFSKKWIFRGFLGYGTTDGRFKFSGEVNYQISRKRWTVAGIRHTHDLERVGLTSDAIGDNKIFLAFTRWGYFSNPFRRNLDEIFFKSEVTKGLTLSAKYVKNDFDPLFVFRYRRPGAPPTERPQFSVYNDSHVVFEARFAKNETYIMDGNERITLGTKRIPVITLSYTHGLQGGGFLNGDFNYHRFQLSLYQSFRLGTLGRSIYRLTAGYTPSTVPPPLLFPHLGNETVFFNRNAYNLMNYLEFVSDRYASLQYNHNFEGLLFNRIPLIKKLKWRLIGSANVLWGSQRKENEDLVEHIPRVTRAGFDFDSLNPDIPYIEAGYGIDNIFKIFRIQAIHRLTYLDHHDPRKFGVRFSVNFAF